MKRLLIGVIGLGALLIVALVAAAITIISGYNHLVKLNEDVTAAWSQVENLYQRRVDLIPNLVETVKRYAQQEEKIFTGIADARARIGSSKTPEERLKSEDQLTGFISRLLVITENYPQLKSDQNFRDLQAQLEGAENRISVERKRYIDAILAYNVYIKRFPGRFYASFAGFKPHEFFEAAPEAQKVPKVDFGGKS